MDADMIDRLQAGLSAAFIDSNRALDPRHRPQLLFNDKSRAQKVLTTVENELADCEEFCISVAFITMGGITPLLQTFRELEKRGVRGRILTTDYLNFSEPAALKKLHELKNVTVKMFSSADAGEGFHTKGYIFRNGSLYHMIVGSSNMTLNALTKNKEWNTKLISTDRGEFSCELISEFETMWASEHALAYEDFIAGYESRYEIVRKQREIAKRAEIPSLEAYRLQPNSMQLAFISNLRKIHEENKKRALLISATGTGKTYAAAFALREDGPSRALFLVHREQIAKQAVRSFKNVFGDTRTFGLLSGNSRNYDADYLFATMQMMSKPEIMHKFRKDEFQTIVIDEAHRTGAASYVNIMEYFEPEFMLGMTASPERTDSFDVYSAFDHNIAYEIRLQQALEENLLCPFHYFGITDLEIDGEPVDEETGLRNFARLTSEDRVDYVIEQAEYYGHSGSRLRGLVFCSSKKEAAALSGKFNERGYETLALTGESSQEERESAIERLVTDNGSRRLDYIFTVDIFNEGVDIPEINQVILLRPTESPIIFVQQLGRGLRKADRKEYVVILDFIGNYKNNFMIPIALSGDRSYNKDNIRRYVMEGERIIPGSSTVHFDEISRKRIFSAIDSANFSDLSLIKENYKNLKNKLGHIPALKEFDEHGEMDVLRIFDNKGLGSYYKFLVKYETEYKVRLSEPEEKIIEFVSKKLASGKRIYELELLKKILIYHDASMTGLKAALNSDYGISLDDKSVRNVVNVMTNEFQTGSGKNTYADCVFIEEKEKDYGVSASFGALLRDRDFYRMLKELVEFGIMRYEANYKNNYRDTSFVLYQKYTYEDVCRLLDWESNMVPQNIGGYKYDEKTGTFPVFINYNKAEGIQETIKYQDRFLSPDNLIAISKANRKISSKDVQTFLHAGERGIDVELFVRKNKDDNESKEFYYLGRMQASGKAREFVMENTTSSAVEIEWLLDTPVREDIFEYITE